MYRAGDLAQFDLWFPPAVAPETCGVASVGMVASFSLFVTATMLPTRTTADLLAGTWSLRSVWLGAVPRRLAQDSEAGINSRRDHFAAGVIGFTGAWATNIVQLKPCDTESTGTVERANRYLETSFLPGRRFSSAEDFIVQLASWVPMANARTVRVLTVRPVDLVDQDRRAMLAFPVLAPTAGFAHRIRFGPGLSRPRSQQEWLRRLVAIGRMVDIRADLAPVKVVLDGKPVATHRRSWNTGQIIADPAHVAAAKRMRERFQHPTPVVGDTLARDLSD